MTLKSGKFANKLKSLKAFASEACCVVYTHTSRAERSMHGRNLNIYYLCKSTCEIVNRELDAFYKSRSLQMADDIKALRRATNGDEICRILARIGENLHDIVLCDQYIGHGLVEVLRGG